jgi:hypothetical protein
MGLVMAEVTSCESDGRLIEHAQRGDYDLDQLQGNAGSHLPHARATKADIFASRGR